MNGQRVYLLKSLFLLALTLILFFLLFLGILQLKGQNPVNWVHLSSKDGQIEAPNSGIEQTSTAVADFDNDGINDFCFSCVEKLINISKSEQFFYRFKCGRH